MRAILIGFFACTLTPTAVYGTDREFKDIVNAISDEFHTKPTHIPFFGLVNMVTYVARPAGTKHIDLAIFENLDERERAGVNLPRSIRRAVGESWKPFVQVVTHRSGHDEIVFVYMRMEGHDCRLLVTSIEPTEATVVQLQLNPDALQRWLVAPRDLAGHHFGSRDWGRDQDRDRDEP